MNATDKDKLYDEVSVLEKQVRKAFPKQQGKVMIANAKSDIDMCVGRITNTNEIKWMLEYRNQLKSIVN